MKTETHFVMDSLLVIERIIIQSIYHWRLEYLAKCPRNARLAVCCGGGGGGGRRGLARGNTIAGKTGAQMWQEAGCSAFSEERPFAAGTVSNLRMTGNKRSQRDVAYGETYAKQSGSSRRM